MQKARLGEAVLQTKVAEMNASTRELKGKLLDSSCAEGQLRDKESHIETLRGQLARQNEEIETLKQEMGRNNRRLRNEIGTLLYKNNSLTAAIRAIKEGPQVSCQTDSSWFTVSDELATLKKENAQLAQDLDAVRMTKADVVLKFNESRADLAMCKEECSGLRTATANAQRRNTHLQRSLAQAKETADKEEQQRVALEGKIHDLEGTKLKLEYLLERSRQREAGMSREQKELSSRLELLTKREDEVNGRIVASHTLQEDLVKAMQQQRQSSGVVQKREESIQQMMAETDERRAEVAVREKQLRQREVEMRDLEEHHRVTINELKKQINDVKRQSTDAEAERDTVRKEIITLRGTSGRLMTETSDIASLRVSLQEKELIIAELSAKLARVEEHSISVALNHQEDVQRLEEQTRIVAGKSVATQRELSEWRERLVDREKALSEDMSNLGEREIALKDQSAALQREREELEKRIHELGRMGNKGGVGVL
ncbi:hypothetical protein KIPB_007103, partial [Kipferlia bialata]|eukprot:g7103.t1